MGFGIFHPRKHGLNKTIDHNGVPGAVVNEVMKFDANGLSAVSELKHIKVTRSVPAAGLDYVEIGKFTQSQGSFALLISVTSEDTTPGNSGADLYYIVGKYNETTGLWELAYPLQTIEPHSQLCVMITNDELHLRLIAITSTPSPIPVDIQMVEMGVGDAIFTAASGTGTMALPTTEFSSTLISQVGGKIQAHGEMSMNTEKIIDVVDPVTAQGVATKNYHDTSPPVQATESLVGGAEIATQAETDAGVVDDRIVTPEKLANYSGLGGGAQLFHFDANDATFPASNPAGAISRNEHPVLAFDDSTDENVIFHGSMSKDYSEGNLIVDIDWVSESAIVGDVKLDVAFERIAPGGQDIDSDGFAAIQTVTETTSGTSGVVTRTSITFTQAQADSIAAGDAFRLKITRDTGVGGDMTGDAQILRVVGGQ